MKVVIVGLGTQGKKRKKYIEKKDYLATVDPYNNKADFKKLEDISENKFDTIFICTPDKFKKKYIDFCIKKKKNFLVEKPLIDKSLDLNKLAKNCVKSKIVGYTAYNHRFEPHIVKIKNFIKNKKIGKIYYCKIFYGNGTAKLVKKNIWKDKGDGVISDLGSHLLDTLFFWFGYKFKNFKLVNSMKFENKSPDYMSIICQNKNQFVELEASLCMWKNTFKCDIVGSKGCLSIESLCKWGPSIFFFRKRKYPSGVPSEISIIIKPKKDPTWKEEYLHFKNLIKKKKYDNFKSDRVIKKIIENL